MTIMETVRLDRMRVRQSTVALGPSCAGGGHRRCLLAAEQCPCPCHRDEPVDEHIATPRTFDCSVCFEPFPTVYARALHLSKAHPVGWKPEDDPAPGPCPWCGEDRWGTRDALVRHVAMAHRDRPVSSLRIVS